MRSTANLGKYGPYTVEEECKKETNKSERYKEKKIR
jgi:hypothetical protein